MYTEVDRDKLCVILKTLFIAGDVNPVMSF